jgi:hypothetical protein
LLTADLVGPDDPRWREYLAGMSHDFYHLPEYATFAALHQEPGDPIAFIADEAGLRLLVPLIIRSIPNAITKGEDLHDAISPRGYPGPLLSAPTAPASGEFLGRALDSLAAALGARGIVAAFVRMHPLYSLPMERLRERGTVVEQGDSVAIDLDRSPDELWRQTRANHRRQINKAKRLGHTQRIDDDWERLDAFVIAYGQSMVRLGAAAHWRLSRDYFEDLRTSLGDRVHLCVDEDGDQLTARW